MNRRILLTSIAALLPATIPARPYGSDNTDDLGGGGDKISLSPEPQLNDIHNANGADDTSDLESPDFGEIDLGGGDDDGDVTVDKPEVVTEKPDKPEPEVKSDPVEPEKTEEKVVEKPADEVKTEEKADPSVDEEIEKYQPPANASKEARVNFKQIKELWKGDKIKVRELESKIQTLEEQVKTAAPAVDEKGEPIIPEPIRNRLTELERLEQSVLLEKSPLFAKEYTEPIAQAETSLFEFLKSHGLPDEAAEEIKSAGVNDWPGWGELVQKFRDPLNANEVLRLRSEIRQKSKARESALEQLKAGSSELPAQLQERQKQEHLEWGKAAAQTLQEVAKDHEWAQIKKAPADATAEQKAEIEAHNAEVEKLSQASRERVVACYQRDPKATMETVFKSLQAERLSTENAKLRSDLEAALKRAEELETRVGAKLRAGRQSQADTAPKASVGEVSKVAPGGPSEMSADDAFDAWDAARR